MRKYSKRKSFKKKSLKRISHKRKSLKKKSFKKRRMRGGYKIESYLIERKKNAAEYVRKMLINYFTNPSELFYRFVAHEFFKNGISKFDEYISEARSDAELINYYQQNNFNTTLSTDSKLNLFCFLNTKTSLSSQDLFMKLI